MGLSWYNGHSPEKRERVQRYLNTEWDAGRLPRPTICIACAQAEGAIHGHLEDYDQPTTYVDLCICCHLLLHMRFRHRDGWGQYLARLRDGWQHPALTQREGFGRIRGGVLAGRWPDGLWLPPRGPGYLDQLPMTRTAVRA